MDVARALLDGVEQDHVDELDDGRVLARLLQLHQVDVVGVGGEIDLGLVEAGHDLVVGGANVVVALDGREDGALARDDRLHVEAGEELQIVDGVQVRRIRHGHDE